jgi:hypothetical protein
MSDDNSELVGPLPKNFEAQPQFGVRGFLERAADFQKAKRALSTSHFKKFCDESKVERGSIQYALFDLMSDRLFKLRGLLEGDLEAFGVLMLLLVGDERFDETIEICSDFADKDASEVMLMLVQEFESAMVDCDVIWGIDWKAEHIKSVRELAEF